MKIKFKKSLLFIAIASVTACSQIDNKHDSIVYEKQEQKQEQDQDRVELESVVTTGSHIRATESKKENRQRPRKRPAIVAQLASPVRAKIASGYAVSDQAAYNYMPMPAPIVEQNRENYKHFSDNPVKLAQNDPVSTFSIDVDTGAYSNMRRMLNQGIIPPKDAIRTEELVNYFNYNYPAPKNIKQPFSINTELAPSPWNENAQLLHIGIQGYKVDKNKRPASNLVFLIDVSGSMNSANKLGLLKSSFKLLTKNLTKKDKVAIVVYAGAAGAVLDSTPGNEKAKILQALNKLNAGGSTNGAAGINLAYQIAQDNLIKGGINRVIIATDGDFNVGTTNFEQLKEMVQRKAKSGIALTTLGFGSGNYNDALMEQLADSGNGNYAYIDNLKEANKVLVEEMSSTLMTIAKDVKIQIEFNPLTVSQYRLIGYENRMLKNEDFNNDKIDAGEIGAGHSVTALYEVVLNGDKGWVEPLKYQDNGMQKTYSDEIATLKVRYKQPNSDHSQLIVKTLSKDDGIKSIKQASDNFKMSAAVAGFSQLLRGGEMTGQFSFQDVKQLAKQTMKNDDFGYRGEFLQLVSLAKSLTNTQAVVE